MNILKITTALVLVAGTANAGVFNYEPPVAPTIVPPVQITEAKNHFDGIYVVAFGGATMANGNYEYRGKETNSIDLSGGNYGVGVGWGHVATSGVYFGVEAQYSAYSGAETVECHGVCYACSEELEDAVSIRGRLGFQTGRTLAYGFAGYQETNVSYGRSWPDGSHADNGTGILAGVMYGVGVETLVGDSGMFVGVEYGIVAGGSFANGKDVAVFEDIQQVQLRIGYLF